MKQMGNAGQQGCVDTGAGEDLINVRAGVAKTAGEPGDRTSLLTQNGLDVMPDVHGG